MHTEGEQKFCISHILKNIKARPPTPLLSSCYLILLAFFESFYVLLQLFGHRHFEQALRQFTGCKLTLLPQYDSQRPSD
jgi:hypothetical protein